MTGEGGAGDTSTTLGDFLAYNGTVQQSAASGAYAAGTASNARGNNHPYYQNVFPGGQSPPALQQAGFAQQNGELAVGTVGFRWREVVISRNGTSVEWFLDGLKIATVAGVSTAGSNIFVGYWDPFASLSDNTNLSFGLIDNLSVEVPAVAPVITAQPQSLWAKPGSNAVFGVMATGMPAPAYQWRLNGTNVSGATNAVLALANVTGANAGQYSVVVTNVAGIQVSSNALLSLMAVEAPVLQLPGPPAGGAITLSAATEVGATYALESSTNLTQWVTLTTVVATQNTTVFTPPVSADEPQRYFRLRSGP